VWESGRPTSIFHTTKAFAAARGASYAASGDLTGVVKWGGVGVAAGAAYLCRGVFQKQQVGVGQPPQAASTQEAQPLPAVGTETTSAAEGDDFALQAGLRQRMLQLADEAQKEAEAEKETPHVSDDSSGSTALLERPKEEVPQQDGGVAAPDLPLGYPLRGGDDWELDAEPEPSASDEQIAMLERMFGTRSD